VSRLRRKLHRSGDLHSALSSPPAGYRLLVDPSYVDGLIFRQTLIDIRHATASIDPAVAVARLRAVLAMWRGPVFGGLTGGPICQAASSRFLADREVAVETLYDFELRLGRHCEVIPELSGLLESASLNERTCEQLMVALYRAGRQSDALDTFRRMRSRLDDDLGVEPSPALRRIENAILNHHPALRVGADHGTLRV
jgi:DNA-binding SARP family transcriptional activator